MSEDNPNINSLYHCINCGIRIPDELIKEINGFGGTVVCERCGIQQFIKIISAEGSSTVIDAITDYNESHQAKKIEHSDETNEFSTYHLDREKFGYYLTIFACRYIYDDIKNSYLCLEPTDQYIEMIANSFIKESPYKKIEKKWLNEFKPFKKSLKKNYKELKSKIKSDPAERQKYLGVFRFLTKIVFELINKKDYYELQGIEYDIAEDLIKRDLFVADLRFILPFRYNFRLGLSRVVYFKIKDIARKSNLKLCELKLTNSDKRDIADELVNYIIGHHQIIWDFLGGLEQIQPRAFNELYDQFCLELKSDNLFAESFNYYLRTLVGRIRDICCGRYKWKELCELDRIIKTKLEELLNWEVDFDQFGKSDKQIQNTKQTQNDNNNDDDRIDFDINTKKEDLSNIKNKNKKLDLTEKDTLMTQASHLTKKNSHNFDNIWEKFLHYTHEIEVINNLINEFNKKSNWIKLFRPTKTFLDYLEKKRRELRQDLKNNRSNITKVQIEMFSEYITLITDIMNENLLIKIIRNLILKNQGQFNAYDIQNWLLISDVAARNQLKRMFTEEEYQKYVRTQKHVTIDTINVIAKKRGGKCHTKNIKNAKSRIDLECSEGHHFTTTYDSVVYQNTWCPDCNIYVSESVCRKYFERIFKKSFPKSYPEWLINEKGNQMELDGYNKDLNLAFEYQGIQHKKKAFGMTDKDLQNIQQEDALKLKLCGENNVNLLQIPDDKIVPYVEMQEYIESEYEKKTGIILENIPRYNYQDFDIYENIYGKKFREYVENKGGILLTPYFSAKKEVTIICENGHQWTTTPDSVYNDNWCPVCAGNAKDNADIYRNIGRKFDCELISDYVNAKTYIWFRCSNCGNEFKILPYYLKSIFEDTDKLCPSCTPNEYAENFEKFIDKKNWSLKTPYKGRFHSITIICENGHDWKTTPGAVYQGSVCKTCREINKPPPNEIRRLKAKEDFFKIAEDLGYQILPPGYEDNNTLVNMKCKNDHQLRITPKYFKKKVKENKTLCNKCLKK